MIGEDISVSLPIVFIDGIRVEPEAAVISSRDRGFTLADGLFETMRVRNGVVFRLERHLARLANGLRVMSIPQPPGLEGWLHQAVALAGAVDASIRLTVTRGVGAGGVAPPSNVIPSVVIAINPMAAFPGHIYQRGLRAIIASGRRNARSMTNGLKTLAYTDAILAWLEAERAGADEAIFLDTADRCSEATASNLFIVQNGRLVTPPVSCAALPGVTRATVLELARAAGITAEERAFDRAELITADEAFLTSSLRGVAPISSVDDAPIGSGGPGPVTTHLMAEYRTLIERECGVA